MRMKKMPSAAMMRRMEKNETSERGESPAYQRREKKLGIEKDKDGKRRRGK